MTDIYCCHVSMPAPAFLALSQVTGSIISGSADVSTVRVPNSKKQNILTIYSLSYHTITTNNAVTFVMHHYMLSDEFIIAV